MTAVNLAMAVVALILAAVAYWRAGGQRDVERVQAQLRRELVELRIKQDELVEHANQSLAAAYDRSRERLREARLRLHELQDAAVEGIEIQARRAAEQLERLAGRLDQAAGAAATATVSAARASEAAVARRVRRLQTRVILLEVKAKAILARRAAADDELDRADARLGEAVHLLEEARATLGEDHVFDAELAAVRGTLWQAVDAVRTRAESMRHHIDEVLADTDRVLHGLDDTDQEQERVGVVR